MSSTRTPPTIFALEDRVAGLADLVEQLEALQARVNRLEQLQTQAAADRASLERTVTGTVVGLAAMAVIGTYWGAQAAIYTLLGLGVAVLALLAAVWLSRIPALGRRWPRVFPLG